jgi:hypothetical protein
MQPTHNLRYANRELLASLRKYSGVLDELLNAVRRILPIAPPMAVEFIEDSRLRIDYRSGLAETTDCGVNSFTRQRVA